MTYIVPANKTPKFLIAENKRLREALEVLIMASDHTTYPSAHPIWDAFDQAHKALLQSPDVPQQKGGS